MKFFISLIVFINFIFDLSAQTSQFGTNNYIEYQQGNLPIVISVPHGGGLDPGTIPDRTCNSPVFAVDENTEEVAIEISKALNQITGCYPHIIYNHLNRAKLDANRNLADGACTNASAKTAWNEFHNFINAAQTEANNAFGNNTLYIDLHGHGNPIQRIELGYLLYDDELALPDVSLNTAKYLGYSTIQNLAKTNANNYTHAQLLRGEKAFGSLLNNGSYASVPSATIQFPGTTTNYFSGGYNIANHTSYKVGNVVNGFQMELNYTGIRDTPQNRKRFADTLANVMLKYLLLYRQVNVAQCATTGIKHFEPENIVFYPNPILAHMGSFSIQGLANGEYEYAIKNYLGQVVANGEVKDDLVQCPIYLEKSIYFISLANKNSKKTIGRKLLVE